MPVRVEAAPAHVNVLLSMLCAPASLRAVVKPLNVCSPTMSHLISSIPEAQDWSLLLG